jgi:hypothetical protein
MEERSSIKWVLSGRDLKSSERTGRREMSGDGDENWGMSSKIVKGLELIERFAAL